MRSFFYLFFALLLLVQCKKSGDMDPSAYVSADETSCPNCASVRFYIELSDKNTGSNYLTTNNIIAKDIEIRNTFNQPISSSNISVSLSDPAGVIIFPMPDRSRFYLKVRNNILIEVSYSSKLNNTGQYEISNVKVKDHSFTPPEKVAGGYFLKINI